MSIEAPTEADADIARTLLRALRELLEGPAPIPRPQPPETLQTRGDPNADFLFP
jgi:hypothetical protein